jgi:diaminopimelate decarboxylase
MDDVRDRVARLRAAFGGRFRLSYAVKSNPNPAVLRRMADLVDMLDVSSGGEVRHALRANWEAEKLSFTGPGKTAVDLQTAVDLGVGAVVVESVDEATLLERLAAASKRTTRVAIRIAPDRVPRGFGLNMSGKPSQFGIDEEEIDAAVDAVRGMPHLDLRGFHIFSGTQCLDAEAIAENYGIFVEIFRRVCRAHKLRPEKLIFGSGLGIPYHENDVAVDVAAVAERANPALDALMREPAFAETELVLETGRYLVGEAGVYLTRVVRTKRSRGVEMGICDGGMNHHLGAAGHLGTVIQRNYRMFKVTGGETGSEKGYTLVGPLCTTIDTLGRQVKFRGLEAGDVIGIRSSGAYGVTASPIHFIGHAPPREVSVETVRGEVHIEDCTQFSDDRAIRTRETVRG